MIEPYSTEQVFAPILTSSTKSVHLLKRYIKAVYLLISCSNKVAY